MSTNVLGAPLAKGLYLRFVHTSNEYLRAAVMRARAMTCCIPPASGHGLPAAELARVQGPVKTVHCQLRLCIKGDDGEFYIEQVGRDPSSAHRWMEDPLRRGQGCVNA